MSLVQALFTGSASKKVVFGITIDILNKCFGEKEKMVFFGVVEEGLEFQLLQNWKHHLISLLQLYDKISESHC